MSARGASRVLAGLLLCMSLFPSAAAYAETGSSTSQAADRLFQEGLQEMKAGNYETACPRLSSSYRLDPSPGALFTLAECEASWGKLASALTDYQSFVHSLTAMPAERRATFEERRRIAAGQISVLVVSAPEVTLDVAPDHAPDLIVKLQGVVVPEASYGVGRRLDPGSYSVTAELDGRTVWQRAITVEPDSRAQIQVQPTASDDPRAGADASTNHSGGPSSRKTWVYVAGGVAAIGLSTGLVAGALAYGHKSHIASNCPNLECNASGRSALNVARTEAQVSTVGFSLGIAGAVATVVLLSLAPQQTRSAEARSARLHVGLGNDGKSVQLLGSF